MGLHVAGIVSRRNDWCDSVASALRFGVNNQKVMKRLIFLLSLQAICLCSFPQDGKNYIQPIDREGFGVDSILSVKHNVITFLLSGTEFEIPKSNVAYIEHAKLGHIDISNPKADKVTVSSIPIREPDFIGEVFICNLDDSTFIRPERALGQLIVREQLMGMASKIYVDLSLSSCVLPKGEINMIVRVANQNQDPYTYIKIGKFLEGDGNRYCYLAKENELRMQVTYGEENVFFEAEKYGCNSLLLRFKIKEEGEYFITLSNSNNLDQKLPVSCFGVYD